MRRKANRTRRAGFRKSLPCQCPRHTRSLVPWTISHCAHNNTPKSARDGAPRVRRYIPLRGGSSWRSSRCIWKEPACGARGSGSSSETHSGLSKWYQSYANQDWYCPRLSVLLHMTVMCSRKTTWGRSEGSLPYPQTCRRLCLASRERPSRPDRSHQRRSSSPQTWPWRLPSAQGRCLQPSRGRERGPQDDHQGYSIHLQGKTQTKEFKTHSG